jgi:hypothetical protein
VSFILKNILKIMSLVFMLGSSLFDSLFSQSYPVVFVSRNLRQGGSIFYQQQGLHPGMGPFSRFKVVGGRLLVREANGTVRVLVDSTMSFGGLHLVDISDPCVYWDASKILFAGAEHRDSSWRIYEIRADGTGFKRITFSNRNISLAQFGNIANKFVRYDDIDRAIYLMGGFACKHAIPAYRK